ncbi:MAG: hypothetical protein PHQ65_15680 [Bacteroidales bacterium]|nr:hypothetical protein [Bacteroidales bacterium]MDD3666706.1 hypothetical protein [Bacteroidales bacterium]
MSNFFDGFLWALAWCSLGIVLAGLGLLAIGAAFLGLMLSPGIILYGLIRAGIKGFYRPLGEFYLMPVVTLSGEVKFLNISTF